jgi:hypothetical protein
MGRAEDQKARPPALEIRVNPRRNVATVEFDLGPAKLSAEDLQRIYLERFASAVRNWALASRARLAELSWDQVNQALSVRAAFQ